MMTASIKQLFQSEYSLWFRKALINQSLGGYFELINQSIRAYVVLIIWVWHTIFEDHFPDIVSFKKKYLWKSVIAKGVLWRFIL